MTDADCLRWRTSLAELETTVSDVSANDVPELAGRLEALKVRLVLRLQTAAGAQVGEKGDEDRLLDAQQAAAFDAYITQDNYLSQHRGEYAQRGAVFLPMVKRLDLSLSQDLFHSIAGRRHSGQIRLDITNFGNLLDHNWGVSQRLIQNQILTNATVDAQGRATYRLAVVNGALISKSLQTNAGIADVYVMMLSFRYTFQ